jgi:hypothetical protein
MTTSFDPNTRQAMSQNWDQMREQLRSQFPGVTDQDIADGQSNPEALVSRIAQKTGQNEDQVRTMIQQVVQQFSQQR